MYVFKAGLTFFLIFSVVKSDGVDNQIQCNDYYKDMNNKPINVTHYCNNKSCIIKCCGDGEIFNHKWECDKATKFKKFYSKINYTTVTLYSWEGSALKISNKNLIQDFVFVQNEKFSSPNCQFEHVSDEYYILEDGSIRMETQNPFTPWIHTQRWDHCVDFQFNAYRAEDGSIIKELLFISRQISEPDLDSVKSIIVAIALLTSCFFLLLVLAVYCLLRQLRNIVGIILMAYIFSLFVCFLLRVVMILNIDNMYPEDCKKLSPILYYAALSSFFWLTIMSFDIWWTFRGNRKCRDIHRQGELIKFGWYSLYAWGIPLVLTVAAVSLDSADLTDWPSILKPSFDSCFVDAWPVFYYLQVPIAIISIINIILFVMTAYNIWLIKYAIHNYQDSLNSMKEKNRFGIYIKLAVMMGVSWCLELIPDTISLWLFIFINFYNMFIGVAIFFLFIFKKSILIMLCKRLGIKRDFVRNRSSQFSKTGTTRSTRTSNSKNFKSQTQDQETTIC